MRKKEFFDAMDKLMEGTRPEHVESFLDEVAKEYLPDYRDLKLASLRYCPMCFKYSKKEDFKNECKEVAHIVFDEEKSILVKDVTIHSDCPKCGYTIHERTTIPADASIDDMTVFCKTCKKPHKLHDCKKDVSYIGDSGLTYYASIRFYCPECGKCVKDVSA